MGVLIVEVPLKDCPHFSIEVSSVPLEGFHYSRVT